MQLIITACTVVQAVVKATSQSNGKGQILTPRGSETPERISMYILAGQPRMMIAVSLYLDVSTYMGDHLQGR